MSAISPRATLQDARYGLRLIVRQPGYTALIVATMALGIAATTVLGTVAYGVLLKPLPWADAPRLVRLFETRRASTGRFRPIMTNATYLAWIRDSRTIETFGGWSGSRVTLTAGGDPERIQVADVTPSLLPMLQVTPALGRLFVEGDERPGHDDVAIISDGLWRERFGGRADIVGQRVQLDGTPVTIVGVLPASFVFFDREARVWRPMRVPPLIDPNSPGSRHLSLFNAIGRLRPGVTAAQAAAEGTARGRTVKDVGVVAMAVFGSTGEVEVTATPLLESMTADVRPAILVLLAAVALLLATATANVASLQLARATGRRRELAIRAALGASGGRLVRQALVENLLLGVMGGVAGLGLAAVLQRALPSLLPADFPRIADVALDARLGSLAVVVSMVTGLAFGLMPALAAARTDLVPALVEDSIAPVGGSLRTGTARARALIMGGQVAIACVLLVGAMLLTRSFVGLLRADIGYDRANVLTAHLPLGSSYTPERRVQMLGRVVERLRSMPGVTEASYGTVVPFGSRMAIASFPLRRSGLKQRDGSVLQVQTGVRQVGPRYFAALGQRLIAGREFTDADVAGARPVAMVNAEFARKYLDGDALGQFLPGPTPAQNREIVGVAADAIRKSPTDTPQPETYQPGLQQPIGDDEASLVIRSSSNPRALVPTVRAIVRQEDPSVPVEAVATLEDLVSGSIQRPRLYATLLGTFAAFALVIAGVGLFGVLSYSVAQRSREIAVRTALGAQGGDIVGLVARQAIAIAGGGILAGLVAASWLSRALRSFVFGVTIHDPVSFAAVAVVLLAIAVIASIVPARRAARVDPIKVLRA